MMKRVLKILYWTFREWIEATRRRKTQVRFGDLCRIDPVARDFGYERGTPVDRYYIEQFLEGNREKIRGKVLEFGDAIYSQKYGLSGEFEVDILNYAKGEGVDLVGDLTKPEKLPKGEYDCVICTQVLNYIFDVRVAVYGLDWLLKEGGVLLGTVSGVSQVSRYDLDRWGDYWRFTSLSVDKLLNIFEDRRVRVWGNRVASIGLLEGVAVEDLPDRGVLDCVDVDYPVLMSFIAKKGGGKCV